jgi:light-regulated signal transduction histidine kinase (bacteriophytochrome)
LEVQAEELVVLNAELEQRVRERTAQLEAANQELARQLGTIQQAEARLQDYAVVLERSNRDLQEFAYVASHDLQEPLRKILAFGDRLKIVSGEALNDTGRDSLERMLNAAARMQALIDGLLTFSRVSTHTRPFVPVDLGEVARGVVDDLSVRLTRTGGRVEVGDLPTIEADPTQMRQLLQNLIGNALKFHRPEEPPIVRVDGRGPDGTADDGTCQILVEDQGIGFEEKYLDRIFLPFQRLHGRGAYEGTGMGLAICRRIVERHGGALTARSVPEQGATFIVTLPIRQPG